MNNTDSRSELNDTSHGTLAACTNGRGRGYHQFFLADKRTTGPEKACQKEVVSCHVDQTPYKLMLLKT